MTPKDNHRPQEGELHESIRDILYATGKFDASSQERYDEVKDVADQIVELVTEREQRLVTEALRAVLYEIETTERNGDTAKDVLELVEGVIADRIAQLGSNPKEKGVKDE